MKKYRDHFFAVTAPGLEEVCAAELLRLGIPDVEVEKGGVLFFGELRELYLANLWLRTASRILVRIGAFRARDFPELYRRALQLPWGRFLRPGRPFHVKGSSHRSRLLHTGRIASTVAEAVVRVTGASPQESDGGAETLLVRLEDDLCTLSVDTSGELLHRRGYRGKSVPAPLRETLAAGLLYLCEWDGTIPLFDPMCGSGTIPIEGALLAMNRPPGLDRRFAFMGWPRYRQGLWDALVHDARRGERGEFAPIFGSDREEKAVRAACANALCANLGSAIRFERNDFFRSPPPWQGGLLLCNPPYGARLGQGEDIVPFFKEFGRRCRVDFSGWDVAFLCPDERLAEATGLDLEIAGSLANGGIPVTLYRKGC